MSAPGAPARRAAAGLLAGVLRAGQSLSDQTASPDGPLARLAPAERARARALATTTLRHLGRIDATLARFLRKRPPPGPEDALRLACAELMVEGAPAHAAVDGAVRLARAGGRGAERHAGLVNAVARRLSTQGATIWAATPETPPPDWIAGPVREAWGAAALERIAAAHAVDAPPLDLTPRDPGAGAALATDLGAEHLPTGSLRLIRPGQVSTLPGFAAGAWWVQDAAAAIPARLLGDVRGLRALDLCAAPGGKTLQLAAAGAQVTALDVSEARLGRLRENLARTGLAAEIVVADARRWRSDAAFDAIVLDAPCSATGTLRRHPDLPWLRDGAALGPLVAQQDALLAAAWQMLRPGGRLVFCTCSLLPAEGEERVEAFLEVEPSARVVVPDAAGLGLDPGWVDVGGLLRLRPDYWPERGGMDGFFAALLEKPAGARDVRRPDR